MLMIKMTYPMGVLDRPVVTIMAIELPITVKCRFVRKHYVSEKVRNFTDSCLCPIAEFKSAAGIIRHQSLSQSYVVWMKSVKPQNSTGCWFWNSSTSLNITQRDMRIQINHCQNDENSWIVVVLYHNATTISRYSWSTSLSSLNDSNSSVVRVVKSPWIILTVIPCRSAISASTCPERQQNINNFISRIIRHNWSFSVEQEIYTWTIRRTTTSHTIS